MTDVPDDDIDIESVFSEAQVSGKQCRFCFTRGDSIDKEGLCDDCRPLHTDGWFRLKQLRAHWARKTTNKWVTIKAMLDEVIEVCGNRNDFARMMRAAMVTTAKRGDPKDLLLCMEVMTALVMSANEGMTEMHEVRMELEKRTREEHIVKSLELTDRMIEELLSIRFGFDMDRAQRVLEQVEKDAFRNRRGNIFSRDMAALMRAGMALLREFENQFPKGKTRWKRRSDSQPNPNPFEDDPRSDTAESQPEDRPT